MAEYIIFHQFAEIGDSIYIPETAVGITINVDPEYRNRHSPTTVNVCWLEEHHG